MTYDDEVARAARNVDVAITSLTRKLLALDAMVRPGHPLASMTRSACTVSLGLQQVFGLRRELEPQAEKADDFNVPLPFGQPGDCSDDVPF